MGGGQILFNSLPCYLFCLGRFDRNGWIQPIFPNRPRWVGVGYGVTPPLTSSNSFCCNKYDLHLLPIIKWQGWESPHRFFHQIARLLWANECNSLSKNERFAISLFLKERREQIANGRSLNESHRAKSDGSDLLSGIKTGERQWKPVKNIRKIWINSRSLFGKEQQERFAHGHS